MSTHLVMLVKPKVLLMVMGKMFDLWKVESRKSGDEWVIASPSVLM